MTEQTDQLQDLLDEMEQAGDGDTITIAAVLDVLGTRSFGPMLLLPALVAASPLSGIVGISAFCGLWIALIAAQFVLRRDHVWLPQWMQRRSVSRDKAKSAIAKLKGPAGWIDSFSHKRLTFLLRFPFGYAVGLIILAIGLCMPFLEFVPFSGSAAGIAVSLLGFGIGNYLGIGLAYGVRWLTALG